MHRTGLLVGKMRPGGVIIYSCFRRRRHKSITVCMGQTSGPLIAARSRGSRRLEGSGGGLGRVNAITKFYLGPTRFHNAIDV